LSIETVATTPADQALPVISGTAQESQHLSAAAGTWSGTPPISYAYQWQRCDASGDGCVELPSASGTTYTPTAADVGNTLRVVVTASNGAGSSSTASQPTPMVVAASDDTSPPSAPADLTATADQSSITLSWNASSDDVATADYDLFLNGTKVASTEATSYSFGGLSCGTGYTIGVAAYDAAGHGSPTSALTSATAACSETSSTPTDTTPPTPPSNLQAGAADQSSITLKWSASSDDVAVAGYDLFLNGTKVASTGATSYSFGGLSCGTGYTISVAAYDAAGNRSPTSALTSATAACSETTPPDTTPPTPPSNLQVGAADQSSISLSWSASSDDVAVTGYYVFLNGEKVGSTTATSYTFSGLKCGASYTLGVQAYDAAANVSTQSSVVAATSPCQDTSPPLLPTGLAATAGSTSISALWNPSFDNFGVSGYDVFLDGSKVGSTALTNYTFGGLTCGTSYTVGVDAYDAAGNVSARASVAAATSSCTSPPPPTGPQYRYMYDSGSDQAGVASYGWNLLDVGSKSAADALPAGTKGLVWVGDYDNSTCGWQVSDASLQGQVSAMVGDAKVAGYFFSDEPNPYACPGAPAAHKARSSLLHTLDPGKLTVMVMDANSGNATLSQIPLWLGAADYIGLDPYPCYQGKPCDYAWIDQVITAADQAGLPYWGVAQAFNDSTWRWPTPDEESHMLSQWAASKESGYMTFAWTWAGNNLASQPALLDVFKQFNDGSSSGSGSADTTPPSTPTGLSEVSSNTTSVSLSWNASTDDVGVGGYGVYREGALVSSTSGTSYTVGGLACGTSYTFSVDAYDAAGNRSAKTFLTAATSSSCPDTLAPTTPGNLTATAATQTSISTLWSPSFDNVGVNGYDVFLNDNKVGSTPLTGYTFSGLACGTNYTLGIEAYDAAGNHSARASIVAATSACPDLQAPGSPSNLTNTGTSETNVSLSWSASTDNVGVVGYDVYRNGTELGGTAGTSYTFAGLACGTTYTLGVDAYDAGGNHSVVASLDAATSACSSAGDPVIAAAGDICWTDTTSCSGTATLLDQINPDAVLTLGDNQYDDGALSDYNTYYKPQWGRHDFQVYPSPGNHEFHVANAQGYRDYYGARAPALTYSFDLGAWHLVSLAGAGISVSTQNAWLQNDLASHVGQCILAYWHEPRFSSGTTHGSDSSMGPLWTTLYNAHAAVVLNGHEHMYERFALQNPSGVADPNGIREFVVGTGGVLGGYGIGTPIANSEVRNNDTAGVIKLTLHPTGYDWQFVPQAGKTFTDSGSGVCPGASQPSPMIQSGLMSYARSWAERIPGSGSSLLDVLKLFRAGV